MIRTCAYNIHSEQFPWQSHLVEEKTNAEHSRNFSSIRWNNVYVLMCITQQNVWDNISHIIVFTEYCHSTTTTENQQNKHSQKKMLRKRLTKSKKTVSSFNFIRWSSSVIHHRMLSRFCAQKSKKNNNRNMSDVHSLWTGTRWPLDHHCTIDIDSIRSFTPFTMWKTH